MRQKREPQRNLLHLMAVNKVARDLVKYRRTDTGGDGMTA